MLIIWYYRYVIMILDDLDKQLMQLLEKDATLSSKVLAEQLNTSAATIRRRMSNLLKSGVLRVVGLVDIAKVGSPVIVCINLRVRFDKLESVLKVLARQTEVKWISSSTGRFDILTLTAFNSTSQLQEFYKTTLGSIDGILNAETSICLEVKKGRYMPL